MPLGRWILNELKEHASAFGFFFLQERGGDRTAITGFGLVICLCCKTSEIPFCLGRVCQATSTLPPTFRSILYLEFCQQRQRYPSPAQDWGTCKTVLAPDFESEKCDCVPDSPRIDREHLMFVGNLVRFKDRCDPVERSNAKPWRQLCFVSAGDEGDAVGADEAGGCCNIAQRAAYTCLSPKGSIAL